MEEKNILITGATGGIGNAIAEKMKGENHILLLNYCQAENKKGNLEKGFGKENKNTWFFKADLTIEKEVERMMNEISKIGDVDIIIHCVSLPLERGELIQKGPADFQRHFDLQVKSLLGILKRTIPQMKKNKFGRIITVITEGVIGKPPSNLADYVTAKYALLGFSKCLAVEYGKFNITCNSVSPGLTETALTEDFPNKLKEIVAAQTPLGRICKKEDIAGVVKFLCSDEAGFINGENIAVNGGCLMR